jgi:hypothetical protein
LEKKSSLITQNPHFQTLIDLKGILFVTAFENQLKGVEPADIVRLYESSKSEQARIEEHADIERERSFSKKDDSVTKRIDSLHEKFEQITFDGVLRDSALEQIKFEEIFNLQNERLKTFAELTGIKFIKKPVIYFKLKI